MEIFDVCDENGIPTGETVERSIAHRDGIMHRTVHIWITRKEQGRWQVLLQQRSFQKDSFPGLYDTSSAGHMQAGDEPVQAAMRELEEELGICASEEELKLAGTYLNKYDLPFHGKMFRDREVTFVFVLEKQVRMEDIHIQQEELEGVDWFDLEEVFEEVMHRFRQRFCCTEEGLKILKNYLQKRNIK